MKKKKKAIFNDLSYLHWLEIAVPWLLADIKRHGSIWFLAHHCTVMASEPRGSVFPGQRLSDEKKELSGQVHHKRTCGNKLLFLQLGAKDGEKQLEAIFSFDVYGSEVRDVRKDISVGDVVSCVGTWRECGHIMDVFSYTIQQRWADVSGGASFQAPEAKKTKDEVEEPPSPPVSTSKRRNLCKFWMSNGSCQRSQCVAFHPQGDELKEARLRWRQEQSRRQASNALPEDPHTEKDKKSHAHRAAVFADWICETHLGELYVWYSEMVLLGIACSGVISISVAKIA